MTEFFQNNPPFASLYGALAFAGLMLVAGLLLAAVMLYCGRMASYLLWLSMRDLTWFDKAHKMHVSIGVKFGLNCSRCGIAVENDGVQTTTETITVCRHCYAMMRRQKVDVSHCVPKPVDVSGIHTR